jgi:hypothetical protein
VILPNPHVTSSLLGSKVLCVFKKKNLIHVPSFTPVKGSRNEYSLCTFIFYFLCGRYEIWCPHFSFAIAQETLVGQGRLIEASQSYSDTSHSVGLLWTSDQPVAETSTL